MIKDFSEKGNAVVLVVTQVLAILGILASSGQVVVPAFFEAIFIGYFATITVQAKVAAKAACDNTLAMRRMMEK
jgi:hypothetical protein